jgi:acetylornithine deacetylase/succinyl-diaminopimelate desuccinylase-like protein
MTQSEKLLLELIAIPSVNPAFLPPNDPRGGEQGVADFLAATAATAGLGIEFQEVFPGRSNLLIRLSPRHEIKSRILLAPHLDTVGDPEMAVSLFIPQQKNGRIHGRGACDTKGSVAAMLTALLQLAHQPGRPSHTEIIFAGLIDEENGQSGSRHLAQQKPEADLAIVGEPTELLLVTAHKGDLWLRLETLGKSAHGARPELGRNAVHAMARIVDLIETQYAAELRRRKHPLLGHPTINVGAIQGGTQPNIVPDRCEISMDRRTLPGENETTVRREILAFLKQHQQKSRLLENPKPPCLPLQTNPKLPLVRQFLAILGNKQPSGVDYFCDAAILAAGGIPSVVFGPGNIAQAHTADEWISVNSLERGTQVLRRFLESLP